MESPFQQVGLEDRDTDVATARNDVGRSGHSIQLPQRSLIVVVLLCFPWSAAKVPGIVECQIVIAPDCGMFNGPGPGNRSFEAARLRDEPIREVSAIAVAAYSKAVGIGNAVANERVNSFQDVLAGRETSWGEMSR